MNFRQVEFVLSAHAKRQFPETNLPEIAFAGRSNVGKSSLINRLLGRKHLVKTSSKPGKTQGLNYYLVGDCVYFVDLPGYGFAQVSKQMRSSWGKLIAAYLEERKNLVCVIIIIDLRHELKALDRELITWLRYNQRAFIPVYTKADKLTRNKQFKHAAALDAGLTISADERIIFSAKTGQGCEELQQRLGLFAEE